MNFINSFTIFYAYVLLILILILILIYCFNNNIEINLMINDFKNLLNKLIKNIDNFYDFLLFIFLLFFVNIYIFIILLIIFFHVILFLIVIFTNLILIKLDFKKFKILSCKTLKLKTNFTFFFKFYTYDISKNFAFIIIYNLISYFTDKDKIKIKINIFSILFKKLFSLITSFSYLSFKISVNILDSFKFLNQFEYDSFLILIDNMLYDFMSSFEDIFDSFVKNKKIILEKSDIKLNGFINTFIRYVATKEKWKNFIITENGLSSKIHNNIKLVNTSLKSLCVAHETGILTNSNSNHNDNFLRGKTINKSEEVKALCHFSKNNDELICINETTKPTTCGFNNFKSQLSGSLDPNKKIYWTNLYVINKNDVILRPAKINLNIDERSSLSKNEIAAYIKSHINGEENYKGNLKNYYEKNGKFGLYDSDKYNSFSDYLKEHSKEYSELVDLYLESENNKLFFKSKFLEYIIEKNIKGFTLDDFDALWKQEIKTIDDTHFCSKAKFNEQFLSNDDKNNLLNQFFQKKISP